jgi:GAF domain-containing protein
VPDTYGVAGWCFQNEPPLIINDACNDPRFYDEVDKTSGLRTRNILCIPLVNRHKGRIGALQTPQSQFLLLPGGNRPGEPVP